MKKIFLFLVIIMMAVVSPDAKIWDPNRSKKPERVVFNPDVLATSTKSLKIDRIEFYKDSTLVKFTVNSPSNRSVKVDRNLVLEVNGDKIYPVDIHGLKFGQSYKKDAWSSQSFVMVYPGIKDKIERLDVLELGGTWNIYGIRLDGKQYQRLTMTEWKRTNVGNIYDNGDNYFPSGQFISPQRRKAVFEGYINGYDPRAFQNMFYVVTINEITGVPESIAVPVADDGSFRVELETYYPKFVVAQYPLGFDVRFLIEPDRDVKAYYDRNVRLGQINGNVGSWELAVVHAGDLGRVNDQVRQSMAVWTPTITRSLMSAKNLEDAKKIIDRLHSGQVASLKSYASMYSISPYAEKVILAKEKAGMIYHLLQQELRFKDEERSKKNGKIKPLPEGYYDFLKNELNDELVISTKYFPEIVSMLNASRYREVIGLRDAYAYTDQNPDSKKWAIAGSLKSECEAICKYLGVDVAPLWWQIKSAMTLVSGGMMNPDEISKKDVKWVMNELCNKKVITQPAVIDALNRHYGLIE